MSRALLLFLLILAVPQLGSCAAAPDPGQTYVNTGDEQAERDAISSKVEEAVAARDFAGLSAQEAAFRTSRARTSSGKWKLELFHHALLYSLADGLRPGQDCRYQDEPLVRHWADAYPTDPTPAIVHAALLHEQAWCLRGAGYANTVAPDVWPRFRELLERAAASLTARKAEAGADPQYYAVALDILRSQGAGEAAFQTMVEEATAREPAYAPIYFEAVWHYLPQWGGSDAAVDGFARYAATRGRSSEASGLYARIYLSLEACSCHTLKTAADWGMLKQSMRDIFDRYPTRWNAERFADLSCGLGQGEEGRRYIRAQHPDARGELAFQALFTACDRKAQG